jgi:hypothetical protein
MQYKDKLASFSPVDIQVAINGNGNVSKQTFVRKVWLYLVNALTRLALSGHYMSGYQQGSNLNIYQNTSRT